MQPAQSHMHMVALWGCSPCGSLAHMQPASRAAQWTAATEDMQGAVLYAVGQSLFRPPCLLLCSCLPSCCSGLLLPRACRSIGVPGMPVGLHMEDRSHCPMT